VAFAVRSGRYLDQVPGRGLPFTPERARTAERLSAEVRRERASNPWTCLSRDLGDLLDRHGFDQAIAVVGFEDGTEAALWRADDGRWDIVFQDDLPELWRALEQF
jgi:hypothetical protein